MASLGEIRSALKSTIESGVTTELFTYDTVSDLVHLPAVVVEPAGADYAETMSTASRWTFKLYVLVSRADTDTAQELLDGFLSDTGSDSIRQALWNKPGLGLPDGAVEASVRSMRGYGGTHEDAKVSLVGAVLIVTVHTDGSS